MNKVDILKVERLSMLKASYALPPSPVVYGG
jgi:hypothetical protein